ncbi:MAG: exo-alpha-sialidase [Athalassotoga sp.]|uniref:exo-alpha-sialidase n=1 Tax=Athalassotoga sp. TaxID=2022597 RepID=UPI003CFF4F58
MNFENVMQSQIYPPMHHCVSVTKDRDDLIAVWYSASYEKAPDSVIHLSRKHFDKWTDPVTVFKMPGFGVGNPVIWKSPEDELWLFLVILTENDWQSALICRKKSKDHGENWSELEIISNIKGIMTKGRPIVLKNGNYLLPVYDEKKWTSMILISEDGNNWKLYGETTVTGLIQPVVVELDDGILMMMSRSKMGKVYVSYSFNGGLSWMASAQTDIPNPNSSIDVVKYKDMLVLAHNHTQTGRNRMDLLFSKNEGRNWSGPFCVKEADRGEYSYPWLLQDEKQLHLFFTDNRMNFIHSFFEDGDFEKR